MDKIMKNILEHSTDIQYFFNVPEQKFEYVSSSLEEHLPLKCTELLHANFTPLLELIHPEDKENIENYWQQIFSARNFSQQQESIDFRCRTISGKFLWFSDNHRFIKDSQNLVTAIVGSIRDITDLKVVEILKSTSKERLTMAMEAASDSLWEWKVTSNRLFFDSRFYVVLGFDPYEFPDTFEEWERRMHPDDRKQALTLFNRCAKGETDQIHLEYRITAKDKTWKWLLCRAKIANYNSESKPIRIIGTQTDITKLKQAEAEILRQNEALRNAEKTINQNSEALQNLYNNLKEREERLKLFFNEAINISFMMFEKQDANYIISEFSPGSERLFVLKKEDVIGKLITDIFNAKFNAVLAEILNDFNFSDNNYRGEMNLQNSKGEDVTVLLSIQAINTEIGRSNTIIAIATDITERKKFEMVLRYKNEELVAAEEELKATNDELKFVNEEIQKRNVDLRKINEKLIESEEKFRELAENTNDVFWLRNKHALIYINPAFEKIWGRSPKEVYENPELIEKWVHPEDKNRYNKWIDFESMRNIPVYSEQYRIIKPDGSVRWLWSRVFPVYNQKGEMYRVAGIATDFTEQKETEDALVRAKEKAMESDRLKSAFLANISHEIRTPMNGILGFVELLNDPAIDSETRSQYVSIISKSSQQLLHIIDDIIDISKIEANQLTICHTESNINEMLRELQVFYEKDKITRQKENIKIKIELSLADEQAKIFSDETRLRQIIMNLADNAMKFTQEGEITLGYTLVDNKILQFYVKDTGIGISENQRHNIFERFRQADESATRRFGGTGLGLSICEGLVKLFNGNIWFESAEKIGSTFYFSTPYHPVHRRILKVIEPAEIEEPNWQNKIILVVEDDEINFEYLKAVLEPSNAIIIHAPSGEEAIRAFSSNDSINLVLMDIRLPGISGYEAMRMIKQKNPTIPVIAQTAFAMAEDYAKCLEQGFDDYVSKPINRKNLIKIIQKQLQY